MKTALLYALAVLLVACSSDPAGSDAGPPDAAGEVAPEVANTSCAPCPALVGKALRITSLLVTSPDSPGSTADDAIRDFLTEMWERDLRLGLINMLMVVTAYDPITGVFDAEGGSAWLHPDGKGHYICGYHWPIRSTLDPVTCLTDSSAHPSTVAFHAGPGDAPNTCAPDGTPPDSITLTDVATHGQLQVDCAAGRASFTGATLQGWIHEDTAKGLCACMSFDDDTGAYTCDHDTDPAGANYCFQRCGHGYALVGTVFEKVAKVPVVDGPDGVPSFPLGRTFSAETIEGFVEGCCRGVNDCDAP